MVSQLCHQMERQLRSATPGSFLGNLPQLANLGPVEKHYLLATACEVLPEAEFGVLLNSGALPDALEIYQDGSILPGDELYYVYPWAPAAYRSQCLRDAQVKSVLPGRFAVAGETVELISDSAGMSIRLAA